MLKLFEKFMTTRAKRTKQYRNDINDAWYNKYFKRKFINLKYNELFE